jgi:Cys-tRNA(Pro)/Cys-tRNA(Cys) deacylase
MIDKPPASLALDKLGIPHKIFRHSGQVNSLEQAAQERGQRPEQVVRSILFRLGEGEFIMALVAGPAQISWKRLRQHLGQSRLTMASEAEVLSETGYGIGTVSPFGLPQPLKILIDPGVFKEMEISIGSGIRNTGIILSSTDLQRALQEAEIVQLIEIT